MNAFFVEHNNNNNNNDNNNNDDGDDDNNRHERNLSVAWVDVRKAYDSVDDRWLNKIMLVHRFPVWVCEVVRKLCSAWNTRIVANTKVDNENSPVIPRRCSMPALVYVVHGSCAPPRAIGSPDR